MENFLFWSNQRSKVPVHPWSCHKQLNGQSSMMYLYTWQQIYIYADGVWYTNYNSWKIMIRIPPCYILYCYIVKLHSYWACWAHLHNLLHTWQYTFACHEYLVLHVMYQQSYYHPVCKNNTNKYYIHDYIYPMFMMLIIQPSW